MSAAATGHTHRHERGANLVEMALVLPLLLLILAGVADLGRAYHTYITIINASREGARYAADHPADAGGIIARAQAEAAASDVTIPPGAVSIEFPTGSGSGHPACVVINMDFPTIMSVVLGVSNIPMRVDTTFRIR